MGYKIKNGKMVRTAKPVPTLYHFTPPPNLPEIFENGIYPFAKEENALMLPSMAAIWLTSDPNGTRITEAHLAFWRRKGGNNSQDLIAQHEAGRRLVFGCNDTGSARITVELPKNSKGLFSYLGLLGAIYWDHPKAFAFLAEMPGTADWWVVASPADGETFLLGIGPGAITEVQPIGEATPDYIEAIEQITKEYDGEERAA